MNYNKQALDFLKDTSTTLEVKESDTQQKAPFFDNKKHIHYIVTLKNQKHVYSFDFWNSENDFELIDAIKNYESRSYMQTSENYRREALLKRKDTKLFAEVRRTFKREDRNKIADNFAPSAYDVLAGMIAEYGDFEEFCGNFGYNTDSIKAKETFEECRNQELNLRKLFTHEELEKLAEIN